MSGDEAFVFLISGMAGLAGAFAVRVSSLPRVYTRGNPGIGLIRLAIAASVIWTAYVIQYHGDPSIKGVYVAFYLVMAYAATKVFGQIGAQIFGLRLRSDIYERKNLAGAQFVAAFALSTGIVFGGSLWGEADPLSEAEGGWWIPVGFFLMGYATLVLATALYLWREPGRFRRQICQERDETMAWSAAVYTVSASTLILRGVAGDFWGWRHGILGMGTIVLMLVWHEFIVYGGSKMAPTRMMRALEQSMYIGLTVVVWLLSQMIDRVYGGG